MKNFGIRILEYPSQMDEIGYVGRAMDQKKDW